MNPSPPYIELGKYYKHVKILHHPSGHHFFGMCKGIIVLFSLLSLNIKQIRTAMKIAKKIGSSSATAYKHLNGFSEG